MLFAFRAFCACAYFCRSICRGSGFAVAVLAVVLVVDAVAAWALVTAVLPTNTLALNATGQSIFENLMDTSNYYQTRAGWLCLSGGI
jgi:hypothetical protein